MLRVNRLRQQNSHQISPHSLVAQTASAITIFVGCLVLLGWWLDLELLKNCFCLSIVTMKANAALCFILSGVSLWLSLGRVGEVGEVGEVARIGEESTSPSSHTTPTSLSLQISRVCATTVLVIAALTLGQYLFSGNLGIDQLLVRDSPNALMTSHPGRMGLNTAVNFLMIGRALELIGQPKSRRSYWYAQVFVLVAALMSLKAIIGYAYGVDILYGFYPYTTSMALHTALTFTVLCAGLLWTHPDQGLMRIVTSETYGGLLARRLLLAAIAVPLVLGWLILQGLKAGFYESAFAVSLLVVVLIVSFCVLIWESVAALERLGNQRDRVKEALRANEEKLNSFVDANVIGILFGDIHGNVHKANDEFLQMIGYTRQELEADKIRWIDITPLEYLSLDKERIAEAREKGACTPYEKEYIRKDGSRVSVLVGYSLVGEKREESVAFILDLTARKQAEQALRQSQERFRLALDNIPDVFAIYDAHRRLQFVNAAALQRVKKPKEEILGRTDEEIFPPEATQAYLSTLIKAQETRTLQKTEATITLPDYGTFTTEIKYLPLLDEKGDIEQILAFTNDITERKQVEETLRNQQKWLEDLLNLMPMPMLLIEQQTAKVTFANKAADEVAGGKFPKAESTQDYGTYYYSTDAAGNTIPVEQAPGIRVAHGERIEGFELDWHTPVGVRSLLIFADTLPAMHGHPATCVLVFQDISNLKRVEKALSLGYRRLHLLFNTASDLLSSQQPVALIDSLYRKLSEQIRLDVYFNYLVDEDKQVLQLKSYSGVTEELAKEVEWMKFGQGICGTTVQERRPIALENVQQSSDLKTKFIRSMGITAYYSYPLIAQGQLLGTLAFGSRRLSRFSHNELGMMQAVCDQIAIAMERAGLIASLQQQTEQLREANRMKDEFLAILSHELRSPLNAILGWAQLLRSRHQLDQTKVAKALETIERNARAQTQLIEDLLDISRMIRGKLRLHVRTCDLVPIIDAALETVRLAAEAKEINLSFYILDEGLGNFGKNSEFLDTQNQKFANEQPNHLKSKIQKSKFLISGDGERLQQAMWNLLSNAIKFTPQGGQVEVQLRTVNEEVAETHPITPHYAQILVSDTGIGISSDFLPYVFDRFRQADSSSTRSHGGLGLGLAIVRHLVELHGGTVHVESPGKGQGATFTVKLPLLNNKENQRTSGQGETARHGSLAPVQATALVVDAPEAYPKGGKGTREIIQQPLAEPECKTSDPYISLDGVRVLVVDDEADTRDFLTTVLQQCQAEVKAVGSAQEALDAMTQWKPDVLVSDIGMPEEDGYSLIRKVRSKERAGYISLSPQQSGKIPAAAITAYARPEDRMRAIQEGYQLHLPKPVEPAELATVVASLVGRT
ncbi:PAS domain-containing hybrid sensor histidine kinase/response regulator [Mastigocladopsis repens]|uniref:PAS domain-containing hybrid sensor histidine kinase/response regulator n=1 Tax=Mastigocladopsis repens TaxID=221287 RepID=UPI0002FC0B4D|nr:PAS domain S-box protein [Mastigocladopsis repens]